MIHKKIILSAILTFFIVQIDLKAQNAMYINEKSGTKTSILISNIRKLTFPTSQIEVSKTDGNTSNYLLSNIQFLNFTNSTTGVISVKDNKIIVFPNPVSDWLQISYESNKTGTASLVIVDLQGKVILQQYCNTITGINLTSINVSQIPQGFYICRMQDGANLQTFKFLKN